MRVVTFRRMVWILLAALWYAGSATAQGSYPDRPVRIVVGFSAGGSSDILARLAAQTLTEELKQNFLVENRVGASGNIGAEYVARAAPDGYTLFFATTDLTLNGATADTIPFDPVRDFAPITQVTFAPLILFTRPDFAGGNFRELLAYAKANPNKLNYASTSRGTTTHLAAEQLKLLAGVNFVHVPYKGAAPAVMAVLSREVEMLFTTHVSAKGQLDAGKLAAVAIASKNRSPLLPEVPTFAELGYPIEFGTWFGLLAPSGTPPAIVDLLAKTLQKASQKADFKDRIAGLGGELIMSTPEEFRAFVTQDVDKWKKLVKDVGYKDLN